MRWMIVDGQYGSTGKGLIAGYLALRRAPTAVVSAWGPNAGHTYINALGRKFVHRMIPNGIVSPKLNTIFIGPGSVIDPAVMMQELDDARDLVGDVDLFIHEHAAIVTPKHAHMELEMGLAKIGSTLKGNMAAQVNRMLRDPTDMNIARVMLVGTPLEGWIVNDHDYTTKLAKHDDVQIEGAQGYSLSMYHGLYPYVTSRDVTPWQIAADCGLPWAWHDEMEVVMTMRTYPIRVNNREGSSGPGYPDQKEIKWSDIKQQPELTTVTQLPRRLFTFSWMQAHAALLACGGTHTSIFLNFANYIQNKEDLQAMVRRLEEEIAPVHWIGHGPTDNDIEDTFV